MPQRVDATIRERAVFRGGTGLSPDSRADCFMQNTSQSLLLRIQEKDEEAWNWLQQVLAPSVYRFVRHYQIPETDAPDVTQEVFIRVLRGLSTFRWNGEPFTFRKWLKAVTRNVVLDYWRARKGTNLAAGGSTAFEQFAELAEIPWDEAWEEENFCNPVQLERRVLEMLRAELNERDRDIMDSYGRDEPVPELLARHPGLSAGNVYKIRERIKRRAVELKQLLKTELEREVRCGEPPTA
jgi:RNA polymerase sigma factor (sigma-70 family)